MKNEGVPPHAEVVAHLHVGLDRRLGLGIVDGGLELGHVEADLAGVLLEIGRGQRLLVGEQLVVHLPELALLGRGHGGDGGGHGVVVEGQRVVAEGDLQVVLVDLLQLIQRALGARAVRALELGERDERDLGLLAADLRARCPGSIL